MTSQLAEFKESLEEFAVKHKKEINQNPVFRNQFLKMCQQIGVDPLSSNKGFWVNVLGVGDFYYELAVSLYFDLWIFKKQGVPKYESILNQSVIVAIGKLVPIGLPSKFH